MTLELNKPYLVKRVASNGGVLHYLPMDGFCDDIALDAPVLAKRVASNAGVLHYLIGNQQLAADGKLTLNKPYLAKRVASNAGVLHYLVGGKVCDGGGGGEYIPCEEDDDCDEVLSELTLSVNSLDVPGIPTDDPSFLGDFPLTYLENELTSRDVSAECEDQNVGYGTGWFSEWFDNDTVFPGGGAQFRYFFFACTGVFAIHYRAVDGLGCYPEEPYVYQPNNYNTTMALVDCDPFLMTHSDSEFTGSVSE